MRYFSAMHKGNYIAWQDEGQWTAHDPEVPGVYGLGDTLAEAERDLAEGLDLLAQEPQARECDPRK